MPKGFGSFFPSLIPSALQAKSKRPSRESGHDKEEASRGKGSRSGGRNHQSRGPLNPRQQLEESYAKLLKNEGAGEAWRQEFFQKVRILVLGRSGVGKTTLIRLVVGKDGPQSVSEGVAGVQNINEQFIFSSEDQGVPLFIHDSNGMDLRGSERVEEIKDFLDEHQKGDDFTERVHLVWYVISAIDTRCVDDGDVMKMISDYKIPLLLIMTHDDHDKKKVTDRVLDMLLQKAYAVEEERKTVKNLMVRVGNDGVSVGRNNELIIDNSKRDTNGLKQVVERSRQLMDKKLRYTWIAAQAVDVEKKLEKSAGIIAGFARKALFAALPRAIPFADPLMLAIIFYRLVVIMSTIWLVPPKLNKALKETLLQKEASCRVLRTFGEDLVYAAGLTVAVGATVLLSGATLPLVVAVLAASGILNVGKAISLLVIKTFALQVLGTILYVKSSIEGSSTHRWRPGVSKEEFMRLCEEFAHNAEYQRLLVDFAKGGHSVLDIAVRKEKVKGMMKSDIVRMYTRLLRDRPNSLSSFFGREATDVEGITTTARSTRAAPHVDHRPTTSINKTRVDQLHDEGIAATARARATPHVDHRPAIAINKNQVELDDDNSYNNNPTSSEEEDALSYSGDEDSYCEDEDALYDNANLQ